MVKKVLRFALKISPDIRALHVDCGEGSAAFQQEWRRYIAEPTQQAGVATPQLVVLPSRYRLILAPIVEYILEVERCCPNQQIAVHHDPSSPQFRRDPSIAVPSPMFQDIS